MLSSPQIVKEVRWALWLTVLYIIGWAGFAYLLPDNRGLLGFPIWFELACVYLPCLFTLLIAIVVKLVFKEIDLESKE